MAPIQHFQSLTAILLNGAMLGENTRNTLVAAPTSPFNQTQLALLAGGVVALLFVATWHRRGRVSNGKSIRKSDQRRGQTVDDRTLRNVEAVIAQLDQLSRQINGKIDLKLATLQKVIRDADQRIDQLSRMQRGVQGEPTLDIELESEIPNRPVEDCDNPHDAVYRLADSGYTPLQIAKQLARHTGEVELILSLRRAKHSPSFDSTGKRKQAS